MPPNNQQSFQFESFLTSLSPAVPEGVVTAPKKSTLKKTRSGPIKISDIANRAPVVKAGDGPGRCVGIEIELENTMLTLEDDPISFGPMWSVKKDGSLRNWGAEFVSNVLRTREIDQAVVWLYQHLPITSQTHQRCGTHVHVDVRDFTMQQVKNLVGIYTLLEPIFYDFVGGDRESSIYCIPFYRAPSQLDLICKWENEWPNPHYRPWPNYTLCKYVGLYTGPCFSFGTVEFRMAPAWIWSGRDKLIIWAEGLSFFVNGTKEVDLKDVLNTWENSPHTVIEAMFPKEFLSLVDINSCISRITEYDCAELAEKVFPAVPKNIGWRKESSPSKKLPAIKDLPSYCVLSKPNSLSITPADDLPPIHWGEHAEYDDADHDFIES